jgi:hypothetical protein
MSQDDAAALQAAERWKDVERVVDRLQEKLNSLPDSFVAAAASLQVSSVLLGEQT